MEWTRWGVVLGVWLAAHPARAQPGSIQIVSAAQITTGDPLRLGGQSLVEPDLGLLLYRPGLPFGTFELDFHVTRRHDRPHLGRGLAVLRGRSSRGLAWRLEAGDTYVAASGVEYGFLNLFAPPLAVSGVALSLETPTSSLHVAAGQVTALRNLFGTDPETLGQTIVAAGFSHRLHPRVRATARASGVRTTDLAEFGYAVAAGRDAGAGVVVSLRPQLEVVADVGLNRYRRRGAPVSRVGPSALVGTRWSFARGWLQVNAQHFSPGQFPALNMPFHDRRGAFASGELDLFAGLRLLGGVDAVRTNLSPRDAIQVAGTTPPAEQVRTFGGLRLRVGARSFVTLRAERGARLTRPVALDKDPDDRPLTDPLAARVDSHADVVTGEWHGTVGGWTLIGRAERRTHLQVGGATLAMTEDDGMIQALRPIASRSQLFGSALVTRRRSADRQAQLFWQANLGGQWRLPGSDLDARVEATAARTYDFERHATTTRRALSLGLSGRMTDQTAIALNFFLDRTPLVGLWARSPWMTRTLVRVTRTMSTGAASRPVRATTRPRRPGATGAVTAFAYADWNADGVLDPGEEPVAGVSVRLGAALARTGSDGRAAFVEVPAGPALLALDPAGVPATFDPPAEPAVSVAVAPASVAAAAFPLVPLGAIRGRLLHDANGNGQPDEGDRPLDEVVVLLDGGARSELVTKGRFRFDAVRAGSHHVELLVESLEPGTTPVGDTSRAVTITREEPEPEVVFLVRLAQRAEIRRVFPPQAARAPASPAPPAASTPTPRAASSAPPVASRAPRAAVFTVQVSAMRNAHWVAPLVDLLRSKGYPVYVVSPVSPDDFHRVQVGHFDTRAEADAFAARLRAQEGLPAWVTRSDAVPARR